MSLFGWSLPPGCGTLPDEEDGALEVEIDNVWYAWDESENVFKYVGAGAEREDGFTLIGKLEWDDAHGSAKNQIEKFLKEKGL